MKKVLIATVMLCLVGCGKEGAAPPTPKVQAPDTKASGKHEGWWCAEHGVPEHQCSMCDDKLAKSCKEKGDWCEKHERAKSHCFICDPKLKDKFKQIYIAKYGKEPPPTEE